MILCHLIRTESNLCEYKDGHLVIILEIIFDSYICIENDKRAKGARPLEKFRKKGGGRQLNSLTFSNVYIHNKKKPQNYCQKAISEGRESPEEHVPRQLLHWLLSLKPEPPHNGKEFSALSV